MVSTALLILAVSLGIGLGYGERVMSRRAFRRRFAALVVLVCGVFVLLPYDGKDPFTPLVIIAVGYSVLVYWATARLRDRGQSNWVAWLLLFPLVNIAILFDLLLHEGASDRLEGLG